MRKIVAIVLTSAALTAMSAPAFAQSARWSDAEYLKANRCLGLAQAADLGAQDAGALVAQIKDQGKGRDISMRDRAETLRDDARRAGKTRNDAVKVKLLAERDGACRAYLGATVAKSGEAS